MGFVINKDKSQHTPLQKCKFLGFIINSTDLSLRLPDDKREALQSSIRKMIKRNKTNIRKLARLIGSLVAACPAVKYGTLYTKRIEREKFLALAKNKQNFDATMIVTYEVKSDLKWWEKHVKVAKNELRTQPFSMEIFTDASLTGWGAVHKKEKIHGWWTKEKHISISSNSKQP